VAKGTYTPLYTAVNYHFTNKVFPETDGGRDNAFVLVPKVKIYGGFAGTETNISQRNLSANPTILGGSGSANYHVVIGMDIPANSNTLLDGLTITGGSATGSTTMPVNGTNIWRNEGGGVHNNNSSPTFTNVIITGNIASTGGGMGNRSSSPVLTNVTISGNNAISSYGGGIYNINIGGAQGPSEPVLTNVTISGNSANLDGGGIYNDHSSPTFINVAIIGNSSNRYGGGMENCASSPTLINVTISGNSAASGGGGMDNSAVLTTLSFPIVRNSIIWGNTSTAGGNNIRNAAGTLYATFYYSLVEGSSGGWGTLGANGGNNIDGNPLFVSARSASAAPTTTGDYNLQPNSPCRNTGSNAMYLSARGIANFTHEPDIAGNPRLDGTVIDMGAYEKQVILPNSGANGIFYVDAEKTGNGSSWADAYPNLSDPLIYAAKQRSGFITVAPADTIREIWVAKGTYKPLYNADNYNFATKTFPEINGNRDNAFVLVEGVKIYGGFAGTETTIEQRVLHSPSFGGGWGEVILSGDIGVPNDNTDNCYHVVIAANIPENSNTLLDGFTITGGNGNVSTTITVNSNIIARNQGGGMSNHRAAPAVTHVAITGNYGTSGGGMYNAYSSLVLTDAIVSENRASFGGGINNNSLSAPVLTNVIINGNRADGSGGGIYNDSGSSPALVNVSITGNYVASSGGGGGGMSNGNFSSPTLTNVTISGNSVPLGTGGGIDNASSSSPVIQNSIIWGNIAATGNNINNADVPSKPAFSYSLVEDCGGSASWDAPNFGINNDNNIDEAPLFIDWKDPGATSAVIVTVSPKTAVALSEMPLVTVML
jgi:hypothetical protein